jgi:hypothetical protein
MSHYDYSDRIEYISSYNRWFINTPPRSEFHDYQLFDKYAARQLLETSGGGVGSDTLPYEAPRCVGRMDEARICSDYL